MSFDFNSFAQMFHNNTGNLIGFGQMIAQLAGITHQDPATQAAHTANINRLLTIAETVTGTLATAAPLLGASGAAVASGAGVVNDLAGVIGQVVNSPVVPAPTAT